MLRAVRSCLAAGLHERQAARPRRADAGLLGTTTRRGGRRQVTYNGHPLYYYVTDTRPGQITCQDVVEFGGTWLVVDPRGQRDPLAFPQNSGPARNPVAAVGMFAPSRGAGAPRQTMGKGGRMRGTKVAAFVIAV